MILVSRAAMIQHDSGESMEQWSSKVKNEK